MKKNKWVVDGYNTTAVLEEQRSGRWTTYKHICTCDYGHADPLAHLETNQLNAKMISVLPEFMDILEQLIQEKFFNENFGATSDYIKKLLIKSTSK